MTRNVKLYFGDIKRAIVKIEKYTRNLTLEKFKKDDKTVDAVIRNFHIIGEAAKNIPKEIRDKNKNIPWHEIIAMRNILVHEYFGIEIDILWKTIKEDLPEFKKTLPD